MRISKQSLNTAGGAHIGKDDLEDRGVDLDGAGKITILFKLKIGEMVTTIATFGSNVEPGKYKDFCFIWWSAEGQEKFRLSVASSLPGFERSDLRCRQQRSRQGGGGKSRAQQKDERGRDA